MDKVRFKYVYNRKNRLNAEGKALIQLRINYKGISKYYSTRIYILPSEWNYNKSELSQKCENYTDYNIFLNLFLKKFEDFEISLIKDNNEFSFDLLNKYLSGNKKDKSFINFYEDELKNENFVNTTKRKHRVVLRAIEEFCHDCKFNDINYDFISKFDRFLNKKEAITSANTIWGYHKIFKKYINIAVKKELIKKNPYIDFKIKTSPTRRTAISKEELERIENLEINENLRMYAADFEQIRDMFLFSCYTGLRFSDMINLTSENFIKSEKNGLMFDLEKQQKTGKEKVLPLSIIFNGKPEKIIKPYLNVKGRIFVEHTNQHINRTLKTIAIICNISKNLTFHVARHTFGTFLAEITGDPYVIKDLMSHSNIQTSMNYIHENQQRKTELLKQYDWDK